jgi:hypothetical protein
VGLDRGPELRAAGRNMGRRAGTENLIGILPDLPPPPRPRRANGLDQGIAEKILEIGIR